MLLLFQLFNATSLYFLVLYHVPTLFMILQPRYLACLLLGTRLDYQSVPMFDGSMCIMYYYWCVCIIIIFILLYILFILLLIYIHILWALQSVYFFCTQRKHILYFHYYSLYFILFIQLFNSLIIDADQSLLAVKNWSLLETIAIGY